MGERATIDQDYLYGAADAIRRKNGTSNTYTPAQFEAAIDAIPTGITPTGTISITANGTVDVTQYATANVNVSGGGGGAYESISYFGWNYNGSTSWAVLKDLNGVVYGRNMDYSNSNTLTGMLATFTYYGNNASVKLTALQNITVKIYQTSQNSTTVTLTERSMSANEELTMTPDPVYGGYYIEVSAT